MSNLTRILAAVLFATLTVGPVRAATMSHGAEVVAQATGAVQGTATTTQGAPIPGAAVNLVGPRTYSTTTDATGAFSIGNVVPGFYRLTVEKPGYATAQNDFAIVAGAPTAVTVTMQAATFTTLRAIAEIQVHGRGVFNTSTAAVNTLTSANFEEQGQYSVNHTLDQIPGLQISYPTSSADAASPGSIVVPNIRGGLSFETASLIDGHPLAVVDYGDYVTTFLNSYLFSYTEVIKGPGAMSPETNYAIGGTLNFHTKDPTLDFTPDYTFGWISDGGVYWNFGVSDTLGRLGFVVDLAGVDDPGLIHGQQVYFNPHNPGDVIGYHGGYSGNIAAFNDSASYLGNTVSAPFLLQGLAACCYTYNGYFNQQADLLKLQYHISDTTRATFSYLVTESYSDQDANTASTLLPAVFLPASGHGYSGSLAPGTQFWEPSGGPYPGPGGAANEINSEPILQGEISSAIGNNTVLVRYYHAGINRTISEGTDSPFVPIVSNYTFWGVNHEGSNYATYNGVSETTAAFDYYRQYELDKLNGWSFEFTHPYGDGDEVTLSAESTAYTTDGVGSLSGCAPGSNAAGQFISFAYASTVSGGCPRLPNVTTTTQATTLPYPGLAAPSTTLPGGSSQIMNTYMFRDITNISSTLQGTLSIYENTYHNTFANECLFTPGWYGATASNLGQPGAACAVNGFNVLPYHNTTTGMTQPGWITNNQTHTDERAALEWRPQNDLAVRLSAGSAIAPEYLAELTRPTGYISCSACQSVTVNYANPNLVPETSFGYDLGFDYRMADNTTFVSMDFYMTNLFNHFITATNYSGLSLTPAQGCAIASCPVYYSLNENLSNSRFQGVELVIKHIPEYGFGWHVSGSLEHAYPYNIPPNFYCTFTATTAHPCNASTYNTNLNIVSGVNFEGNGITSAYCAGLSAASCSPNGFSNTNIPYLTGNAEVNWTGRGGWKALFGETLLGNNNSFNAPAFWIAYTSLRIPLNRDLSIQISGDNIFNALPGLFEYEGTGTNYALANGQVAAAIENQLGPAVWHVELTKTFDLGAPGSHY